MPALRRGHRESREGPRARMSVAAKGARKNHGMRFRGFLERLGLLDPPVPGLSEVIQEATTTSRGEVDRRAFLRLVGGGALGAIVAPALDLEALIWTPKPMIIVPGLPVIVGAHNVVSLNSDWIVKEGLKRLKHNLHFVGLVNRQYAEHASRLGDTVAVRLPVKFDLDHMNVVPFRNHIEALETVTLCNQLSVSRSNVAEKYLATMSKDDFSDSVIEPAMRNLAQRIHETKTNVFGLPDVVNGNVVCHQAVDVESGLALRAIRAVDVNGDEGVRFGVLGGHSRALAGEPDRAPGPKKRRRKR